eukprot:10490509-Karenia_brevis.AAC.1
MEFSGQALASHPSISVAIQASQDVPGRVQEAGSLQGTQSQHISNAGRDAALHDLGINCTE